MAAGKILQAQSFHENLQHKPVGLEVIFLQKVPKNHVKYFLVQLCVEVPGNLGGKVPVADDVLSSHEQKICLTTSLEERCVKFEFQTDRNYYVILKQNHLALKLKKVKGQGSWLRNIQYQRSQKGAKKETKAEEETENEEGPIHLVTHVNNILSSIFSKVEVCINNQQSYNLKRLYPHNS